MKPSRRVLALFLSITALLLMGGKLSAYESANSMDSCGLMPGASLDERAADCFEKFSQSAHQCISDAGKDFCGDPNANANTNYWELVARDGTSGQESWRDKTTMLLWTSSTYGSTDPKHRDFNKHEAAGICNGDLEKVSLAAISPSANEKDPLEPPFFDEDKMRKYDQAKAIFTGARNSIIQVPERLHRLPYLYEHATALLHGIALVLPDGAEPTWAANGYAFKGSVTSSTDRDENLEKRFFSADYDRKYVRCVSDGLKVAEPSAVKTAADFPTDLKTCGLIPSPASIHDRINDCAKTEGIVSSHCMTPNHLSATSSDVVNAESSSCWHLIVQDATGHQLWYSKKAELVISDVTWYVADIGDNDDQKNVAGFNHFEAHKFCTNEIKELMELRFPEADLDDPTQYQAYNNVKKGIQIQRDALLTVVRTLSFRLLHLWEYLKLVEYGFTAVVPRSDTETWAFEDDGDDAYIFSLPTALRYAKSSFGISSAKYFKDGIDRENAHVQTRCGAKVTPGIFERKI